jgi:glutathione peroxidase
MNVHDFEAKTIDGTTKRLGDYAGKTLLIVNVASQCGLTPQYEGLEALYKKHQSEGLVVLGFPCDQFGNQEPGTESEIKSFCESSYGVTFPLFAKVEVNGQGAHPLFKFLREKQPGAPRESPKEGSTRAYLEDTIPDLRGRDAIQWNFTKFLVDPSGEVVRRFEPKETPEAMENEIAERLARRS